MVDQQFVFPKALKDTEARLIEARRASCGSVDSRGPQVGVACSGGGIRSATVCLGFFQALAKRKLLQRVDYISTISGGGYFGAFLGGLFVRRGEQDSTTARETPTRPGDVFAEVREVLANDQSEPVRWLRKHGRYIAPDGTADYANIAGVYIRNWIGVHYVVAVSVLTAFFALIGVRAAAIGMCQRHAWFGCDALLAGFAASSGIVWSPLILLPLVVFLFLAAPPALGFWLTQYGTASSGTDDEAAASSQSPLLTMVQDNRALVATFFVLIVCIAIVGLRAAGTGVLSAYTREAWAAGFVAIFIVFGLCFWLASELRALLRLHEEEAGGAAMSLKRRHAMARNFLTDFLGRALKLTVVLLAVAAIDTAAQTLCIFLKETPRESFALPTLIGALVLAIQKLAPYIGRTSKAISHGSLWSLAAAFGSIVLALIILAWAVVAYALTFRGLDVRWQQDALPPDVAPVAAVYFGIGLVLTLLTGRTLSFLNLSSLQAFYSARLRRAYLGASNPERTGYRARGLATHDQKPSAARSIRVESAADDIGWAAYTPYAHGGPLHLMGVTVNHTVGRGSDIDLRDRKGFTMTIGPAGMSAAVSAHAVFEAGVPVPLPCPAGEAPLFADPEKDGKPEACPVSAWMAISGAAFSTGLGVRTRLGLSVLLGAGNVRLGYWWTSGLAVDRARSWLRTLFRTQAYLYDEFLGRFYGADLQHWYLSDGGHSENTGAYELVRRRIPIILLLDNGEDADYQFDDLANLVRRVRIDFGARITLRGSPLSAGGEAGAGEESLSAQLAGLRRRKRDGTGLKVAESSLAFFDVSFDEGTDTCLLILLKPTIVGDEPVDVLNYALGHPAFPQEPTSDQFFDEAQWESYRRLGEHTGNRLLASFDLCPPEAEHETRKTSADERNLVWQPAAKSMAGGDEP